MLTFIAAVFVFGILIFFHELGHFLVAKKVDIKVYEFSLGFGTKVFGFKRGETMYNLRLIPLGGYVRMAGMDPEEEDKANPGFDIKRAYNSKTVSQRSAVIVAGPLMNFVLAAILLAVVFMLIPIPTAHIGGVIEGYPAEQVGLMPGDRVVSINNKAVDTWSDLVTQVNAYSGQQLNIVVDRDGMTKDFVITPLLNEDGMYVIGIMADESKADRLNPLVAIWRGIETTWQVTVLIITYLIQMFSAQAPVDLGGPVRIVSEIGNAAEDGFLNLLQLAAFLSINVGLFNLFPIPALDGSKLIFLGWEKIAGKPIDPSKEGFIHMIGFTLLLLLIIVITYKDIIGLITGT
ncbi:RIP metalloprotease RseP [Desulfofalx alkaliphila]|uniref:RIP metalloprotease RseP n=1 Tax=Desulfofalx alkaliphila TaxID=105483 RepID=UPI0004E1DFBB|nr:RIP metalloprotease RseP [Desulfofalx alkaliphila]